MKKRIQNGKRVPRRVRAHAVAPAKAPELRAGIVSYVAMVASLIEGWRVSEPEMLQRLVRAMRQHRMARRRRIDYVVAQLRKHGP